MYKVRFAENGEMLEDFETLEKALLYLDSIVIDEIHNLKFEYDYENEELKAITDGGDMLNWSTTYGWNIDSSDKEEIRDAYKICDYNKIFYIISKYILADYEIVKDDEIIYCDKFTEDEVYNEIQKLKYDLHFVG